MPALNILLQNNTIKVFTKRLFCNLSQVTPSDGAQWSPIPIGQHADYIYCYDSTDLNTIKTWLTTKGYTYGSEEDLTQPTEIMDWLAAEEAKGHIDTENKTSLYDKLHVDFPSQECIGI